MSGSQAIPDRVAIELRGHPEVLVYQDSGRDQTITFHDTGGVELPPVRWLIQFVTPPGA